MFLLTAVHSSQLMCIRSAIYIHYLVCRECLGPIIGGALVYRVGFRTMTAVRFIGIVVCDIKTSPKYFFFWCFLHAQKHWSSQAILWLYTQGIHAHCSCCCSNTSALIKHMYILNFSNVTSMNIRKQWNIGSGKGLRKRLKQNLCFHFNK